ncbi:MAG: FtsX-like permease family protein, partial [Bacteroidales bacterium]|nr:FtsX-like permease family protein [Bacteroidales bacterium]
SAEAAGAGGRMAAARRLPPGAKPDFEIVQADTTQALFEALRQKLSLVALAIGLVTMLGASIGLMNSLLVSVKERTREIGTRRALGARARDIAGQFLMESVLIGQAGNVAGTVLGLAFGGLTAWALDGRFTVPWGWLIAALLLSLVVSLVSGLLPARRAAALDPVEALRSF